MMKVAKALWRRHWHCLANMLKSHRSVNIDMKILGVSVGYHYIGCDCGLTFYNDGKYEVPTWPN